MKTIAVLNQKGGVGKTTTVTNIAAALAVLGAKVAVIDLDPQAHLTIHLGLEPQAIESGSYKVLTQSAQFESEIMMVRPNLWLLPANIHLVGAESELVSVVGRETILREALEANREQFDYCLIDCAPSLGLLTLNALAAAEEVLIPLQPHFLALQGFGKLLETIELVNRRINMHLTVKWILLCMYDSRASLPNEVRADIERFLENARGTNSAWAQAQVLPTFIRRNIKLAEAPSYGKTIFEYEPGCHGAEDYREVAEYIHAHYHGPVESDSAEVIVTDDVPESSELPESSPEIQTEPAYVDINHVESSVETDSFNQSDSQMPQEISEPMEPSPDEQTQPAYTDVTDGEPPIDADSQMPNEMPESPEPSPDIEIQPVGTEEHREKPPIEIREIQPTESQAPAELTETPTDPNQPESDQQQF